MYRWATSELKHSNGFWIHLKTEVLCAWREKQSLDQSATKWTGGVDWRTNRCQRWFEQAPTGWRMTFKPSANDTLQHSGFSSCGMDMIRVVLRLSLKRELAEDYKTSQTSNISPSAHGPTTAKLLLAFICTNGWLSQRWEISQWKGFKAFLKPSSVSNVAAHHGHTDTNTGILGNYC